MCLSFQDRAKAKAFRTEIYKHAEQYRRLFEKDTICAANREYIHASAMSEVENAFGATNVSAALDRLAELNASYSSNAVAPVATTILSRILRFLGADQAFRLASIR